jgi:hypothetical protein
VTQRWDPEVEAICLTAVTGAGATPDGLCRRLGHDPGQLQLLEPAQTWELQDAEDGWKSVVNLVAVGPSRILLLEENGWQGAETAVLEVLSRGGGLAVSAYWNVNWTNRYSVAVDGRVLGALEYVGQNRIEGPPELAPDAALIERAAGADPAGWKVGFLAALEARAGFLIEAAWFEQQHPTLVVDALLPAG